MHRPCLPNCVPQPAMTSSISLVLSPLRSARTFSTADKIRCGWTPASAPLPIFPTPLGERAVSIIHASGILSPFTRRAVIGGVTGQGEPGRGDRSTKIDGVRPVPEWALIWGCSESDAMILSRADLAESLIHRAAIDAVTRRAIETNLAWNSG